MKIRLLTAARLRGGLAGWARSPDPVPVSVTVDPVVAMLNGAALIDATGSDPVPGAISFVETGHNICAGGHTGRGRQADRAP